MTEDDPVRRCLDELRGNEEPGAARKMVRERGSALLGWWGVASGLAAAALDADDGDRAPAQALFRALIREADEDRERRGSLHDVLDDDAALELSDAYARGEVEAPEALVAWLMARLDALAQSETGTGMGAVDEEIERIRQAAKEECTEAMSVLSALSPVACDGGSGSSRLPPRSARTRRTTSFLPPGTVVRGRTHPPRRCPGQDVGTQIAHTGAEAGERRPPTSPPVSLEGARAQTQQRRRLPCLHVTDVAVHRRLLLSCRIGRNRRSLPVDRARTAPHSAVLGCPAMKARTLPAVSRRTSKLRSRRPRNDPLSTASLPKPVRVSFSRAMCPAMTSMRAWRLPGTLGRLSDAVLMERKYWDGNNVSN